MDLTQNKLSKSEWETIEHPISDSEKKIVRMIIDGAHDVNIRYNDSQSLFSHIKIEKTPEIEYFLYKKYFEDDIATIMKKYGAKLLVAVPTFATAGELRSMKSADSIRIQNLDNNIKSNKSVVFEFILIELCKDMLKYISKKKQRFAFYLYTIIQLKKSSIHLLNQYVVDFVTSVMDYGNRITKASEIITNAYEFIERNNYLLKYEDRTLFSHQKELFTICRPGGAPKLVLYTAPTGTGKTLSPLGLSEKYRIIFVCVARHIGLALARSAISVEKKVAFAFGCETASDIRLHYFSAINFTKNRRSGGIWKVDNSVGDNVEIMICDVQSYVIAMHYMLAFNSAENVITYWDEPTITMDYEEHPLHSVIHRNWVENKIPTVVLSCATLPGSDELRPVFDDFRAKFDGADIHTIKSFDCRKSIPILNKEGYCVLPHFMYPEYRDLIQCAEYCMEHKTLLRYFDLREIIRFIEHVNDAVNPAYSIDEYFLGVISDITMNSLKEYYLQVIIHMNADKWPDIYHYMSRARKLKFQPGLVKTVSVDDARVRGGGGVPISRTHSLSTNIAPPAKGDGATASGILITTSDAYTLTDGPTIFLADDVAKIGQFYIQQTHIPSAVFQNIMLKITKNGDLVNKIEELEAMIEHKESKTTVDDPKGARVSVRESGRLSNESTAWMDQINRLRKEIKLVSLDAMYVPNTRPHQQLWAPGGEIHESSFVSNIGEDIAKTIMQLNIDNNLKLLLLLGIGVFSDIKSVEYMEIMKKLADEQRLFIIIASTDYIYGTNYQFCHGFIGKDLTRMTQQKTLQAMGRIGRNNIQQDYTIRFRDNEMIEKLFRKEEQNVEANNMCALFGE